ncbi:MAG: hypothetical protein ABNH26_03395 [Celeribacter sp.]
MGALLLAGCAATPETSPRPAALDGPTRLKLAADGLAVAGSGQVISFSRTQAGVVTAVSGLLGAAPDRRAGSNACHVIGWGGLALHFQTDDFLGWSDTGGDVALPDGVAVGGTGPVPDSIRVTRDAQGRIATLSAGALCPA